MRATQKKSTESAPAFDLKGSALTLMVLHLRETDTETLTRQLQAKFGQAPGFFKHVPLVIDLAGLQDPEQIPNFVQLANTLRDFGLMLTAVRGGNARQNERALAANLGLLAAPRAEQAPPPAAIEEVAQQPNLEPQPEGVAGPKAKIIGQPIRSGQRVVAPHGDLIVLAPVNSGAEILAAGNIHVYGPLRGRALAGVKGDREARIFCLQLHPELVAIAGEYMVNDEMDKAQFGQSAIIALEDNQLTVQSLGTFVPLP